MALGLTLVFASLAGCAGGAGGALTAVPAASPVASTADQGFDSPVSGMTRGRGHAVAAPGVAVDGATLTAVARSVDEGTRAVDAVWGDTWADGQPQLVTVVVGDAQTIRLAVTVGLGDRAPAAGPQVPVAAATVPTWGAAGPTVVIDRRVWAGLSATGRSVVVTHELVHLATGSVRFAAPQWLEEGFADWVAWRQSDLPANKVAREAIVDVWRNGLPSGLPGDADFVPGGGGSPVAYGRAYLAVRLIAETYGEAVLVDLLQRVDAGATVDSALRKLTGAGLADLTADWQGDLENRAATEPAEH